MKYEHVVSIKKILEFLRNPLNTKFLIRKQYVGPVWKENLIKIILNNQRYYYLKKNIIYYRITITSSNQFFNYRI